MYLYLYDDALAWSFSGGEGPNSTDHKQENSRHPRPRQPTVTVIAVVAGCGATMHVHDDNSVIMTFDGSHKQERTKNLLVARSLPSSLRLLCTSSPLHPLLHDFASSSLVWWWAGVVSVLFLELARHIEPHKNENVGDGKTTDRRRYLGFFN